MKKLGFLALGLLCGAILPLTANATIGNGIYTVEGGHKTVIWSGVSMTIAGEDLPGTYYRGFNENTDNSEWIDDSGIGTYYSGGKMYGNTIGVNNAWGGGNDSIENGYNSGLNPERQGPCESGRHVPSPGERSDLLIIRCNVDTGCDASMNLEFWYGIYVHMDGIATKFTESLNMDMLHFHWLSSPYHDNGGYDGGGWIVYPYSYNGGGLTIDMDWYSRNSNVRCFKDAPILPETFTVTFLDDGEVVTSGSVVSGGTWNETISTVTKTGYKLDYRHLTGVNEAFDFTSPITGDITLYAKWSINKDIILEATATEAGQTLKINKYFANAYTVDWGDGTTGDLTGDTVHTYSTARGYTITLSLSGADRWTFQSINKPLVPKAGTTMTGVKIISMPSLADGFGNNATNPGNYFFYSFNGNGALTSLPEGSFDTSNITSVGDDFFCGFNSQGQLINLPEKSFNISNITGIVGSYFFRDFNFNGKVVSLPKNSFDISNITEVGFYFFNNFNAGGQLESLPAGSFDTSNITTVKDGFFEKFNGYGALTSLPEGSFRFSSGLTIAKGSFFNGFNYYGALTSLPEGSFKTNNITEVGDSFFFEFNAVGALTSLPEGSFDFSGITTVGTFFFTYFNQVGALTSLPAGSFKTNNITKVGSDFFRAFNDRGSLESLPEGSFDISNITSAGKDFFNQFNRDGAIINLPDSFKLSSVGASVNNGYYRAFDSINYTLNRNVSSLVSGVTVPFDGRYTFSDNQPGRCVQRNWLINERNACSILYDDGLGGTGEINFPSDSMRIIEYEIEEPTRTGYEFKGWYNTSGEKVDELVFPDMNGYTLYAQWTPIMYTIAFNGNATDIEGTQTSINAIYDIGYNTPDSEFIRNEYIFSSRNSQADGGGIIYNTGAELKNLTTISGEIITLYANWIPIKYKIDYKLNNGEIPGENVTGYTIESDAITLINPTKTGYTFTGRSGTNLDSPTMSVTIPSGSTGDRYYEAIWEINQYTITFKDGENEIASITADYGTGITPPANPTKNGYKFLGWTESGSNEIYDFNSPVIGDKYFYAKWECADGYENKGGECVKKSSGSSGGGGGGGGGGGSSSSCKNLPTNAVANNNSTPSSNTNYYYSTNTSKVCTFQCKSGYTRNEVKGTCDKASDNQTTTGTNVKEPGGTGNNTKVETGNNTEIQTGSKIDASEQTPQDDNSDTQDSSTSSQNDIKTYSTEFQEAYEFAKGNGITTMPTIQKANMDGKLTRIAMAKMLSQYAINVLGKNPDATQNNKFNDVTEKMDSDYDDGVTLAYQLGIMGQNMPGNNFRPNDEVTRAEFATALSRMAYGTSDGEYKGTGKYYIHHMEKLVKEGVITKDDPNMKELRGYVMIMLMRSAK